MATAELESRVQQAEMHRAGATSSRLTVWQALPCLNADDIVDHDGIEACLVGRWEEPTQFPKSIPNYLSQLVPLKQDFHTGL